MLQIADIFKKTLKFLASLKLAVVIVLSLMTLIAVGTIVEAKFQDATAARKLVYDTWWMYLTMGFLCTSLIAVMVDRWPWKKRHAPFVLAHIGILILLFGSWLTMKYGLDGSMRVDIGGASQLVQVPNTDILVYSSFDGDRYTKLSEQEVDFFTHPPTREKPFVVQGLGTEIKFIDYIRYARFSRQVIAPKTPNKLLGAGLRFQVQNANVNAVEWVVQRKPSDTATHNFGPAMIHLGLAPTMGRGVNEIFFTPNGANSLKYVVFSKDSLPAIKRGEVKEGDVFNPGWKMPLEVRALRYLPEAEEQWDVQSVPARTDLTAPAVKVAFEGKEQWMLQNDTLKFFSEQAVYIVSFGNRRIDIGFPIKLIKFDMDRYQGTRRAMSYKSLVEVPELGQVEISMNEPMKHKGLTFYQASFQEDPNAGGVVASILSVNQDPGRVLKYLGSLIICIGTILLFYFKKQLAKGSAKD